MLSLSHSLSLGTEIRDSHNAEQSHKHKFLIKWMRWASNHSLRYYAHWTRRWQIWWYTIYERTPMNIKKHNLNEFITLYSFLYIWNCSKSLNKHIFHFLLFFCFAFAFASIHLFILSIDPIPVTPEPPLKRPTHLDLMPITNFTPKKSPNVSCVAFEFIFIVSYRG